MNVASDRLSHIFVHQLTGSRIFSFAKGPGAPLAGDNGASPMLRKTFAVLLVILTVLPFTAPFPSFDLAHPSRSDSTTVDDGTHALLTPAASNRMRTRFVSHVETSVSTHHIDVPASRAPHSEPAAPRLFDRPSLTALRI
jgi:hypothetical protein